MIFNRTPRLWLHARQAATLTVLALKGCYLDTDDTQDREFEIAKECAELTDLLCLLSRENWVSF